jgi:hypothetical protein
VPFARKLASAERERSKKRPKLDFAVAQYIGVGGSSQLIFGKKIRKHAFPVFPREIERVVRVGDGVANAADVFIISGAVQTPFSLLLPSFS